jgi:hypothetical protein
VLTHSAVATYAPVCWRRLCKVELRGASNVLLVEPSRTTSATPMQHGIPLAEPLNCVSYIATKISNYEGVKSKSLIQLGTMLVDAIAAALGSDRCDRP